MKIEKVSIEKINAAKYNPRRNLQPGTPEYERIQNSVEHFGLVEPLVWNQRTGNLVGGHQRLKVLREQGATEAECSVVDLPESKERALNLALNKAQGLWDYDALQAALAGIRPVDLEATGFSEDELRLLLEQASDQAQNVALDHEAEAGDTEGLSYVVQLSFATKEGAEDWSQKRGYPVTFKPGTHTTVVRIEP